MADHLPDQLDEIADRQDVDTSFAAWARGKGRTLWAEYRRTLIARGTTLNQALREWDLVITDIPDIEGLIPPDERARLLLPGVP
jgi:hypothetical protein